jgi:hypothetical protein
MGGGDGVGWGGKGMKRKKTSVMVNVVAQRLVFCSPCKKGKIPLSYLLLNTSQKNLGTAGQEKSKIALFRFAGLIDREKREKKCCLHALHADLFLLFMPQTEGPIKS